MSRPPLDDFRRALAGAAVGMSDEELLRLQDKVEWFARFAIEQTLAARAARASAELRKSA